MNIEPRKVRSRGYVYWTNLAPEEERNKPNGKHDAVYCCRDVDRDTTVFIQSLHDDSISANLCLDAIEKELQK